MRELVCFIGVIGISIVAIASVGMCVIVSALNKTTGDGKGGI